jgi:hypothetical protein
MAALFKGKATFCPFPIRTLQLSFVCNLFPYEAVNYSIRSVLTPSALLCALSHTNIALLRPQIKHSRTKTVSKETNSKAGNKDDRGRCL